MIRLRDQAQLVLLVAWVTTTLGIAANDWGLIRVSAVSILTATLLHLVNVRRDARVARRVVAVERESKG